MHVFVVRTRLQALIVKQLIAQYYAAERFIVAFYFQKAIDEDAPEVYEVYEELRRQAFASFTVISKAGLLRSTTKYLFLNLVACLSGGRVFLAGIDSCPFALAAKLFPFVKISTFDDGAANFLRHSRYFRETPRRGTGVKARIARTLFPKGCAYWMRQRIREHFTIFPQMDNIVAREKVTVLDWTWSDCFYDSDRTRVPDSAATIMLGLPNHEVDGAQAAIGALHSWLPKIDLYILHPREREWSTSSKCVRFKSPAEAILVTLAAKSKIRVYHFNSTVSFSLKEHPGIDFVRLERGTVAN